MSAAVFILNANDGVDTIHREHPHEECNTDDAEGLERIDELTAIRMIATGQAQACEHCRPMEEPS